MVLLFSFGRFDQAKASAACANSPVEAARSSIGRQSSVKEASSFTTAESHTGFRAVGTLWDPVLQRLWFKVLDCGHSDWPAVLVPVNLVSQTVASSAANPGLPPMRTLAVHAGEAVALTYRQGLAAIRLTGISDSSGYVGDRITLRPVSTDAEHASMRFHAAISGKGEASLLP